MDTAHTQLDTPPADPAAVRTMADLPFAAAAKWPDRSALKSKVDGQWQDRTGRQLASRVECIAAGLLADGVQAGDRVCVLADTSPEWTEVGLAISAAGAVVVPIYPSSSPEECAWVIGDSGAGVLIYDKPAQRTKVESIRGQLATFPTVLSLGQSDGRSVDDLASRVDESTVEEVHRRRVAIEPDDACLIIYTSGTTGPPKGCILTHRNWMALCDLSEQLRYTRPDDVVYLFLPLAHVFAQLVQFAAIHAGATLAYFGGDISQIVPELVEAAPTFLPSVPRIFEKVYTAVTASVPPEQLAQAVKVGLTHRQLTAAGADIPLELAAAFAQIDPLFAKVRGAFGGRLRQALSGAAPISPAVLEFFHAAGVPVLEGYGMTETTGCGTVNTLDHFKIGSVGVASPGIDIRTADDGEILMRGPNIFAGYWNNPAATADTMDGEWIKTGDLGSIDDDGFITITGRKKDIIITAGGKNITPANLENQLRQSKFISHAVMYGDRRPYPVALLTLDPDVVVPWAQSRHLPTDLTALAANSELRGLIQTVVDEVNGHFTSAAQIKRFAILDRDLSLESGELTPSLKMKRNVIHANHAELFDSLYA